MYMQVHTADHRLSVRQADLPMLQSAKDDRMQEPRLRVRRRIPRQVPPGIGYRRRSSTRMVAPTAFSPSSKKPKWYPHQSSEPPCSNAVSTNARAEQRSHRSAAVKVRAGFLSSEVFISAIPSRPSGDDAHTEVQGVGWGNSRGTLSGAARSEER